MVLPIERNVKRYREIVRRRVREDLQKHMSDSELIGRLGKHTVSIPIKEINLPYFRFGGKAKGTGQGDGEVGQPIFVDEGDGEGNEAGDQPGKHIIEVEFTIEELAEILGEELELPNIQPKEQSNIDGEAVRYTSVRRVGPESLRYFKRTYREALKRQVASGTYDYKNPVVVPISDDKRYRSWKVYPKPNNNAVVFFMRDISGSMTREKTDVVRLTNFWIDVWLRSQYEDVIRHYIVHEAVAAEVNADEFYSLRVAGGTKISTGLKLCRDIIFDRNRYPVDKWNLYLFSFSDGENFSNDDNECIKVLEKDLLPILNMYCFGQVKYYGGFYAMKGFLKLVKDIKGFDNISGTTINSTSDVYVAIKKFLGRGK